MEEYTVRIQGEAAEDLKRLDSAAGRRIFKRLDWLRQNLDSIAPEALTGNLAGRYKLRAGDYRVIYEILRDKRVIVVQSAGHRKDVYRRR